MLFPLFVFFFPSQQVSTQTFIFLIPSLSTYPTKWLKYLSQLYWAITQRDSVMSDFKRNILSWKFGILSIKWVIPVLRIGHSPGCCESWYKMLQCFVWAPRWKFKVYFPCIYSTFTLQILTKYQHPSRKFWVYPLSAGVPVALRQSLTVGIVTLFDGSWGDLLSYWVQAGIWSLDSEPWVRATEFPHLPSFRAVARCFASWGLDFLAKCTWVVMLGSLSERKTCLYHGR